MGLAGYTLSRSGWLAVCELKRRAHERRERMHRVFGYLRDDQGVETLEWIVVGALIVFVAIAVYQGALTGQLQSAVNTIGTTVQGIASS